MKKSFEELEGADLIIDCIYEGGNQKNAGDDPLHKLFPKCGTQGGFRKVNRKDNSKKPAYIILYTSMVELEWLDYIDEETGKFRYYGDNRKPGAEITNTKLKGNKLLEEVFDTLNSGKSLKDMPPFFVFKKTGHGRNVQFLGLAAPGNPDISPDEDLVAFWRTMDGKRFQNYRAYFTILDTGIEPISQDWLVSLIDNHENNLKYAPAVWKEYIEKGRNGINALKADKLIDIPNKEKQLECDEEGKKCIDIIYNHYKDNPYAFENCAIDIINKMDSNFNNIKPTRHVRDGGRDGIGTYVISTGGKINRPLEIDCSIEAKCYDKNNGVGVKEMSRLISRIRHRQFGILVTTSYINNQAYKEVLEDEHPILLVTASDIAAILRHNSITTKNIDKWLEIIDG